MKTVIITPSGGSLCLGGNLPYIRSQIAHKPHQVLYFSVSSLVWENKKKTIICIHTHTNVCKYVCLVELLTENGNNLKITATFNHLFTILWLKSILFPIPCFEKGQFNFIRYIIFLLIPFPFHNRFEVLDLFHREDAAHHQH